MAKQELNAAQIGAGLEQVDREGVPERMGRDRFGDAGAATGPLTGFPWTRRSLMGCPGRSPGNSQCGGRFTRHQSRRIASSFGESIT